MTLSPNHHPLPSLPPPISHLMCGGCWEPHAKMNNNRLLVTIAHEHTRGLSLSPPFSLRLPVAFFLASLSASSTHTNSVSSVIYGRIEIQFHCAVSLSLSPCSPQCSVDIWVEGHTTHSSLPRCARDLLSVWSGKLSR